MSRKERLRLEAFSRVKRGELTVVNSGGNKGDTPTLQLLKVSFTLPVLRSASAPAGVDSTQSKKMT